MGKKEQNLTVQLNLPEIHGNKIRFSWFPNFGLNANHYEVEYLDLERVEASPGKLTEAYFPLCLAFALKGLHIKLPVRISEEILNHWHRVIAIAAAQCCHEPAAYAITNGTVPASYKSSQLSKTALCFGGGTESLLTLAHLLDEGIRPVLASFGGPAWSGSNPEKNPDKFSMDEKVAHHFNLALLRVRSNFRELIPGAGWEHLKKDVSFLNAVLLLPFFISLILPVSEQLGISRVINGNEKMNFPKEYFCFSPPMTSAYGEIAARVHYESALGAHLKEDVCRELYVKYPEFAKYQYSCWRNQGQRWCYQCESCMEYYALLKNYGVDPALVGLESEQIQANRNALLTAVVQSAESRRGELWQRMCDYPELQHDAFLRDFLMEVKQRSGIYHTFKHFYNETPHWMKQVYRLPKKWLKQLSRREEPKHAVHAV